MANFDGFQIPVTLANPAYGVVPPHDAQAYSVTSSTGTASVNLYLMRGVVAGSNVYWYATIIDITAIEYTGGGGTPTSIVLIKRRQ